MPGCQLGDRKIHFMTVQNQSYFQELLTREAYFVSKKLLPSGSPKKNTSNKKLEFACFLTITKCKVHTFRLVK